MERQAGHGDAPRVTVAICKESGGWVLVTPDGFKSDPVQTYPQAKRKASAIERVGVEVPHQHAMNPPAAVHGAAQGYPEWEIERDQSPAFVKLVHVRGDGRVESHALAAEWDDVARVDFYQRDWTADGIPTVRRGDTYWSGWWFATIAERDRFLSWVTGKAAVA